MPVREVDIQYEFPTGEYEKYRLIREHWNEGRLWLSTAIVDGKMRMRFGRFEHYQKERLVRYLPEIGR